MILFIVKIYQNLLQLNFFAVLFIYAHVGCIFSSSRFTQCLNLCKPNLYLLKTRQDLAKQTQNELIDLKGKQVFYKLLLSTFSDPQGPDKDLFLDQCMHVCTLKQCEVFVEL